MKVTNEFLDRRLDAHIFALNKQKAEILNGIEEAEQRVHTLFNYLVYFQTFLFIAIVAIIVFAG